jgi:hypothetical protein
MHCSCHGDNCLPIYLIFILIAMRVRQVKTEKLLKMSSTTKGTCKLRSWSKPHVTVWKRKMYKWSGNKLLLSEINFSISTWSYILLIWRFLCMVYRRRIKEHNRKIEISETNQLIVGLVGRKFNLHTKVRNNSPGAPSWAPPFKSTKKILNFCIGQ